MDNRGTARPAQGQHCGGREGIAKCFEAGYDDTTYIKGNPVPVQGQDCRSLKASSNTSKSTTRTTEESEGQLKANIGVKKHPNQACRAEMRRISTSAPIRISIFLPRISPVEMRRISIWACKLLPRRPVPTM
ncbi:hypothetical protein HZ326_17424 [Fusarium oxysporum f. sp. albedinis]|nr:hypothetical protein HZ326_17424 [Fusarium oxysporum f. sp. albedinis]